MRLASLALLLLLVAGCGNRYVYSFATASNTHGIPADSLKWKYEAGAVIEIPVRNSGDEILRLYVDEQTLLHVTTTEKEEHYFTLRSLKVEDKGDGLLGSNTTWRGYDTRQGAERSVVVREVLDAKVLSTIPAAARIEIK